MSYSVKAEERVLGWSVDLGAVNRKKNILNYGSQWDSLQRAYETWQKISKMEMYKTTFL